MTCSEVTARCLALMPLGDRCYDTRVLTHEQAAVFRAWADATVHVCWPLFVFADYVAERCDEGDR